MSPTAASLAKYGDIPVNYYSGAPSISIPLFDISSGKLRFPVNLSYQFNGLKTEEIAGWVGLGWALNAGGSISRTVRGTADEDMNGYMNASSMSVQYMINHPSDPNVEYNLKQAGKGLYDLEPDIFFFNFLSYSGKFYYCQEDQKFYTLPKENLTITYNSLQNIFTILTPDGNKFIFDKREITTTTGQLCGSPPPPGSNITSTTTWYLSAIKNSDETESINLEYTDGVYTFEHFSSETKYFLTAYSGSYYDLPPPEYGYRKCTQSSTISAKRLSYVYFRNGYLKFSLSTADRCDLPGERALNKIELFDNSNNFIKGYTLAYNYFGDVGSPEACNYPNNLSLRLKLASIQEEGTAGTASINPYMFEYEEDGIFPSRLSNSQDYWGYYNTVTANQTLIPPSMYVHASGSVLFLDGADRKPNYNGAKLGSIKKIVYPTKGTTEFMFENNEVKDSWIQPDFQWHQEAMEGDHLGVQTYYEKIFTVNESPSFYNFNNPDGGAFIDYGVAEAGCPITQQANTCAVLSIEGLSPGTIGFVLSSESFSGRYLPNGTYKMTASFSQNPPNFQDFYFYIKWRKPVINNSNQVGGIRIKQIKDFDGIDHSKDIIRTFSYHSDQDGLSSGTVYSYPYDHTTTFSDEYYSETPDCIWLPLYRTYLKRSSLSNYPLVSAGGGGYVGYTQVTESAGQNGENGRSVYYYRAYPDLLNSTFPFTATSREWRRGLLLESRSYQQGDILKTKESNTYDEFSEYDPQISKVALGLKTGFNKNVSNGNQVCGNPFPAWLFQLKEQAAIPLVEEFETLAGKSILVAKSSTSYEASNYVQQTEEYTYNNKNFLPVTAMKTNSQGENIVTKYKYNTDYSIVNNNPAWLYEMQQRKISAFPVEKLVILKKPDNSEFVIGGTITVFRTDMPLIDRVYVFESNSPVPISSFIESYVNGSGTFVKDSRYKEAVVFNKYDQYYNLLSQQKANDIITSYIWGYNQLYPVAQIIGKSYDDAVAESGIDLNIINNSATDDNAMRVELDNLRSLAGTQVTTYTYEMFKGITSETDPRGRTIYYEYDDFNRLVLVRDHEQNILKKICYNYAGQPENCTINCTNTSANWQNTANLRCQQNAGQNTGYQEQEQVDVNPCSPTYNQAQWILAGYNPTACPVTVCSSANCSGDDKKCINGVCETGVRINKSSTYSKGTWTCRYVYRWSDCSESAEFIETGPTACTISPLCY